MNFNCSYKEIVDIFSLNPHEKNPNKHTEEQIKKLAELINYQGQRTPVIVSNLSNRIVAGHGRLLAMKFLNWEKVAVDYQDFESDEQEYAFLVSDNAISDWSTLDLGQINQDIIDFGPELDIEMLGIKEFTVEPMDSLDLDDEKEESEVKKYVLEITFPNEMELRDIYDDLTSRGYIVKEK